MMYQNKTWMSVLALILSVALMPSLAEAKFKRKRASFQPQILQTKRSPSSIDFTSLIAKSDRRRSKLERRIKIKTATMIEKKGEPRRTNSFKFEDVTVKWQQPGTKPAFNAAASEPRDIHSIVGEATVRLMPKNN